MTSATLTPVSAADVRAWATERSIPVGARGRIPADVVEAYNKAHRSKVYDPVRDPSKA